MHKEHKYLIVGGRNFFFWGGVVLGLIWCTLILGELYRLLESEEAALLLYVAPLVQVSKQKMEFSQRLEFLLHFYSTPFLFLLAIFRELSNCKVKFHILCN